VLDSDQQYDYTVLKIDKSRSSQSDHRLDMKMLVLSTQTCKLELSSQFIKPIWPELFA